VAGLDWLGNVGSFGAAGGFGNFGGGTDQVVYLNYNHLEEALRIFLERTLESLGFGIDMHGYIG